MANKQIAVVYGYIVRHGGIGRYISEVLKNLQNVGRFTLLTLEEDIDNLPKGIKTDAICCGRNTSFMNSEENKAFSLAVRKKIALRKFALVHSHGVYDFAPGLYTAHICLKDYFENIRRIFGRKLLEQHFGLASSLIQIEDKMISSLNKRQIVAVSSKVADELEYRYGIKPASISFGSSRFNYPEEYRDIPKNKKNKKKIVGFIGNNIYSKGLIFLKDALSILSRRGVKVICISAGTDSSVDKYMSEQREFEYIPLGKTNVDEGFYKKLDCFASLSTYEAFSLSTLEAMSLGIPVISSRLNGVFLEAAKRQVALCTDVGDITHSKRVADLIERVCTDNHFRYRAIEEGKKFSSMFSWKNSAQIYAPIYQQFTV